MKALPILALILFAFVFSCTSDATKTAAEKDSYEKTKESLEEKEEKDPSLFLIVNGNDKRNLFGQTVIKGVITNSAKVAVYKDVDLKLSFYSKTKALLETDKETVFEIIHPGETKNFKTKYFAPKGTDSVALEILSAKIVKN
jgi:hypothetical protein